MLLYFIFQEVSRWLQRAKEGTYIYLYIVLNIVLNITPFMKRFEISFSSFESLLTPSPPGDTRRSVSFCFISYLHVYLHFAISSPPNRWPYALICPRLKCTKLTDSTVIKAFQRTIHWNALTKVYVCTVWLLMTTNCTYFTYLCQNEICYPTRINIFHSILSNRTSMQEIKLNIRRSL